MNMRFFSFGELWMVSLSLTGDTEPITERSLCADVYSLRLNARIRKAKVTTLPAHYNLSLILIAPLHPHLITPVNSSYGFASFASFSTA